MMLVSSSLNASDWVYTVVEGDNLWNFSERHLDSALRYEQLRKLNNVKFPRRMQPGERIRVPMRWIRSNPAQAVIAGFSGTVRLIRGESKRAEDVSTGTLIALGDTLQTSHESSVAVRFADDSIVTLHQDSEMQFDHLSAHGETGMVDSRLRLKSGRLDTRVTPAVGPGSRFEIHTPSAISAVRGTRYRAAVDNEEQASGFEVLGGKVAVSQARVSRLVKGGQGLRVAQGVEVRKPKPLLPPPASVAYPEPVRYLNDGLTWQEVPGAAAYKVEIGLGESLDVIAWERETRLLRTSLPDLPDGAYLFRIRAIDGDGLQGRDYQAKLVLDTQPRPPVPLRPRSGATVRGQAPELEWTGSVDAEKFILEIASDSGFTSIIDTVPGLGSTGYTTSQPLPPGTYFWRVISVDARGEHGPPSMTRHWVQKRVPEGVDASVANLDGRLHASWPVSGNAAKYQVQLASDKDFKDLVLDEQIGQAKLSFDATSGEVRYLRVRVIEEDGYLGPWGAVQRIDPPHDPSIWGIPLLGILGILVL